MSTSFRRKVASMVTQCVSSVHKGLNTNVTEYVSKLLKVCPKKSHETQVWLAWKSLKDFDSTFLNLSSCDFVSLIKKELSENTTGEITGVNQLNDHQQHLVFVVDYKSFVKDTLQLSSRNMEKLSETSTLLSYIPHQKVVVEYSSPNIAKAFHVGHLRSTIIGSFIGNLHEFLGHDVTRLNYLGDWGTQCGLLFAGYQQFGSEDDLHQNPLYHLLRVYVMANKEAEKNSSFLDHAKHLFSQMENGNKAILTYWKKFRDLSIEEYNKVYNRLGVKFDKYESESMYSKAAKNVLDKMEENGYLSIDKNGAKVLKLKLATGQEQNITIAKSDGSTLYLSRDIAAAIQRKATYNFDKMLYVVDNSQSDHFSALFSILKLLDYKWFSTLQHVKFGRVLGMSSRRGEMVFLGDILNEAKYRALEKIQASPTTKVTKEVEEVADILGVSAVLINDLKSRRRNDYTFKWERAVQDKGDCGIVLQYSHARLANLQRNCGVTLDVDCDLSALVEPEALYLVQHLAKFDEVIFEAYESLEPCVLVQYLFSLCHLAGRANKVLVVKNQDMTVAQARLLLFHCAKNVLNCGMKILSLKPLERM